MHCFKPVKNYRLQTVWIKLDQVHQMSLISRKPIFGLFMFFCFTRNISAQTYRNMSSFAGINSVAYVTVPTQEVAKKLAHGLVQNKLAACVNIIPEIISVYEWKNEINEDSELLMMIKTRTDTVDALTKYVKANHPYEVCEVISIPIENGNEDYLRWVSNIKDKKISTD